MANIDGSISVTVRGDKEVERALAKLPRDAEAELRRGLGRVAGRLTQVVRAAGRASSRQSARAASTVRSRVVGLGAEVTAGPHPLLFGSEFGAKRRFGWYSKGRYWDSPERQFRPHLGGGSYWFFREAGRQQPAVEAESRAIADRVIARWSA